ncbi:hypothetical protein SAZ11_54315 [Streptomyces sp. FXJ1.4098]|nr:hypothetical protein [Streptomyces sp. FXJ1.4098]
MSMLLSDMNFRAHIGSHERTGLSMRPAACPASAGVLAGLPVHLEQLLHGGVKGLEIVIAERPGTRDTLVVFHFGEVTAPETGPHGTVEAGIPTDPVIDARCERFTRAAVIPVTRVLVPALDIHLGRLGVLRLTRKEITPLHDEHLQEIATDLAGDVD